MASGDGLHQATVGISASFTIQLVGDEVGGGGSLPDWEPNSSFRFIYVWISSKDQILIAEVVGDGSNNGTLTATYKSDFPGDYLVHVEEVQPSERGEGLPIVGSPFSLKIAGDFPTLDVHSLPVCGSQDDGSTDIADTFWRPGTWLSANVASAAHGVMRTGWVFQPKSCVFDTFSYQDLMLLASPDGEPTWLVVVGGSVQRGVFLTLVDMALAAGQKDDMATSVLEKCWGYADLRVGNLRLTYQDMRLYQVSGKTDSVVCNNEKLTSGSTSAFVHSAKDFLASTVFRDGTQWPATILAPSYLVPEKNVNHMIEVLMDSLPPSWEGKLLFVDHMAGFSIHWTQGNPTRAALKDVRITATGRTPTDDVALRKMDGYQTQDPRVSFMSAFPMYQAKLFENERSRQGIRHYGASIHYHYMSSTTSDPEAHNGTTMVHSTMTEMLANIMLGQAVETKAELYAKAAASTGGSEQERADVGKSFQVCSDCPRQMLPVHVKPIPEPVCEIVESLPGNAETGEVWDGELCPDWCMKQAPVSQKETQSGPVDVRECSIETRQP
ncbi:expressed unknown protein [Ectocarpus siliculosus]|uniref:Uncharacterized protein n=1 Tax=Ectocarpus siliculosus TaxID=2880 RepID=D7FXE0_ECTSI|nr:expressed unknown protein [Ectocarpus siliculosus]|eukprot:CBJ32277.1 expressed unknown protein [Ectocarpus siliculosus]